jgi:hypothetical protein
VKRYDGIIVLISPLQVWWELHESSQSKYERQGYTWARRLFCKQKTWHLKINSTAIASQNSALIYRFQILVLASRFSTTNGMELKAASEAQQGPTMSSNMHLQGVNNFK